MNNAAGTPASSVIDAIIQEVDPQVKTNTLLSSLLTALTVGLAFIPEVGPIASGVVGGATAVAGSVSKALVIGVQQAPGVAAAIWPAGTADVSLSMSTSIVQALMRCSLKRSKYPT